MLDNYSSFFFSSKEEEEKFEKKQFERCEGCKNLCSFLKGRSKNKEEKPSLLIIGQNVGKEETENKKTFTGRTGKYLDGLVDEIGLTERYKICYTNLCKCFFEEVPSVSQMKKCIWFLQKEIDFIKPKVILTLGKASEAFGKLGKGIEITTNFVPEDIRVFGLKNLAWYMNQNETQLVKQILQVIKRFAEKNFKLDIIEYQVVEEHNKKEFFSFLKNGNSKAIDIETNSLVRWKPSSEIISIGLADKNEVWTSLLNHKENKNISLLSEVIQNLRDYFKLHNKSIFHNFKFDVGFLEQKFGFEMFGNFIEDTLLIYFLFVNETYPNSLKRLNTQYLNYGDYDRSIKETLSKKDKFATYEDIPINQLLKYNAYDAKVTLELYEKFKPLFINEPKKRLYKKLIQVGKTLLDLENTGVKIDFEEVKIFDKNLKNQVKECKAFLENSEKVKIAKEQFPTFREKQGKTVLNWSWKSGETLRFFLFEFLGLKGTKKTEKGKLCTDLEVISSFQGQVEELKELYKLKKLEKEKSLYTKEKIQSWGLYGNLEGELFIKPQYKLTGASTGRIASHDPNMQNFPRMSLIRKCFTTPSGCIILSADYGQNELRGLIHYSQEKTLIQAILDGKDLHGEGMKGLYGEEELRNITEKEYTEKRVLYKTTIFGLIYGKTVESIANDFYIMKNYPEGGKEQFVNEAENFLNKFFNAYPNIERWINRVKKIVKKQGYLTSWFGRTRNFPQVKSPIYSIREETLRKAVNFPLQSWSSDVTLFAVLRMNRVLREFNLKSKIFTTIHDAIYLYSPIEEAQMVGALLKKVMENPPLPLTVPLKVDLEISSSLDESDYLHFKIPEKTEEKLISPYLDFLESEIFREYFGEPQGKNLMIL